MVELFSDFLAWIGKVFGHWVSRIGCAGMAAFQLSYGLWQREWPPMITWWLFFGCFFAAAFLSWRDERSKVRDLTRPALRGHIVSIGIGKMNEGSGLTVLLQLTNTGPATIADNFTATVKCGQLTRRVQTTHLPANSKFADESGQVATIDPSDMLYEKLVNPIPEGGRVSGFLFFFAKDLSPSLITGATRPDVTIDFRDASLKQYSVEAQGPGQIEPLYEPGVRDPFIAINSGKQKTSAPNPVLTAIGELKELYYEGDRMRNIYELHEYGHASWHQVTEWNSRAVACAKRQIFADLLRPKYYAEFEDSTLTDESLMARARLHDAGCFKDDGEGAVYQYLWLRVERLKQLIAKIEEQ